MATHRRGTAATQWSVGDLLRREGRRPTPTLSPVVRGMAVGSVLLCSTVVAVSMASEPDHRAPVGADPPTPRTAPPVPSANSVVLPTAQWTPAPADPLGLPVAPGVVTGGGPAVAVTPSVVLRPRPTAGLPSGGGGGPAAVASGGRDIAGLARGGDGTVDVGDARSRSHTSDGPRPVAPRTDGHRSSSGSADGPGRSSGRVGAHHSTPASAAPATTSRHHRDTAAQANHSGSHATTGTSGRHARHSSSAHHSSAHHSSHRHGHSDDDHHHGRHRKAD